MRSCPRCHRKFVDTQDVCPLDDARLVAASGELPAGVGRHLGAYELICLLGEGGMGSIYVARHTGLGRYVAIKTLRPELANRKDNVARFFQEAHTINALRHPNIVESIDLVEDAVDGAYCVLELLAGPDLKTRLARGPLSIESAIQVAVQLADALGKVHAIGVVHRDLKPENLILIERDGRDDFVKLIDFGIAQIGEQAAGVFGTAAYMAPEQAVAGAAVDRRADIYSLGVMLFEMVAGRHPFPSETDSAYLVAHADSRVPRLTRLDRRCPAALEEVVLRCMEKSPDARYASADQVAAALRMIDPHAGRRSRVGLYAGAAVLAAGAGVAALWLVPTYLQHRDASAAPVGTAAAPASPPPQVPVAEVPPAPAPVEVPPAPAPVEVPESVAPATVDLEVTTTPAGATVYRVGETVALGVTPFTVPLPRSDKPLALRFEKPGFATRTLDVIVAEPQTVAVTLVRPRENLAAKQAKVRKPKAPRDAKPGKKVQREGVMDPFANP